MPNYCVAGAYNTPESSPNRALRFETRVDRNSTPGHYIANAPGFEASGNMDFIGLEQDHMAKKMQRLGHIQETKVVGFGLQKGRDNSMYQIGSGHFNLNQMNKYYKSSNTPLFSSTVMTSKKLTQRKKKRLPSKKATITSKD